VDAEVTPRLRIGGIEFGPEDAVLLGAVAAEGSLNAAATALDRSYSRAHDRVRDVENATGPLLESDRGGAGGGGSELTANASELLAQFARLRAATEGAARTPETVFEGTLTERTGNLVIVETGAGRVRARLVEPAVDPSDDRSHRLLADTFVQVSLRADAVTLHTPAGSPLADDTSARNRFEGTVLGINGEDGIAEVAVDVGARGDLIALLTAGSVDRLGLSPGAAVVASFKATATRALPVEDTREE
jgi:molybdate transport system regulatory protein